METLNEASRVSTVRRSALIASGLDYTVLRCGFLMEVMVAPLVGFDYANAKAVVYGSGDNPLSLLSMDDVLP